MKKAYAVIGANFGDEGKGLMTDRFCRKNKNVINVRSNGGAQAGHTVVTADGKRHVFSHIGAGTFAGADTFLSEYFAVNPMIFMKEYAVLKGMGTAMPGIFVSEKAAVSIPCDMLINQLIERKRGGGRHGSCGVGVYESVRRSEFTELRITFGEIERTEKSRLALKEKIVCANTVYAQKRLKELGISDIPQDTKRLLESETLTENYLDDLFEMKRLCRTADNGVLERYDAAVFEGAQGLLLDCERSEYFPNLTPSNTGMKNIRSILDDFPGVSAEVFYVTRSYFTRHGAGRFDTESADIARRFGLCDKTNVMNEFQGGIRFGYFDCSEFARSVKLDGRYRNENDLTAVCVTHLDETGGKVICPDGDITPEEVSRLVGADKLYVSQGETAENVFAW